MQEARIVQKPVMMSGEALSKVTKGIVEVIVDNEASADNLACSPRAMLFLPRQAGKVNAGG